MLETKKGCEGVAFSHIAAQCLTQSAGCDQPCGTETTLTAEGLKLCTQFYSPICKAQKKQAKSSSFSADQYPGALGSQMRSLLLSSTCGLQWNATSQHTEILQHNSSTRIPITEQISIHRASLYAVRLEHAGRNGWSAQSPPREDRVTATSGGAPPAAPRS
jgi:hypothetical protein